MGVSGLAFAWMACSAGFASAADYTWISGGSDVKWTTPENWQGGTGFPGAAGDTATVTAADTVQLDTNGVVTIGRLQFTSSTPKTVTVAGDAGSGFTFSGIAAPNSGLFVDGHAGNRLVLGTDLLISGRMDKMGIGAVEFTGTATNITNATVYYGEGTSIFSGAAAMNFPAGGIGIGNSAEATVILTNQAAWNGRTLVFGVGSKATTKGVLCQDSDDCSVTLTGYLRLGDLASAGSTNGYYYLRKGTLTAYSVTVGVNAPCWFQQSGGSFTTPNVLWVKNGQFLQTGGEASITGLTVGDTGFQPSVALAGGRLLLNGNITTPWIPEKQAFDFTGGVLQVDNSYTNGIPMRLSGTPTFDTPASGKTFVLAKGASGSASLVKTGAGAVTLAGANQLSGNITISNGVFALGAGSVLERYGQSTEPLGMKICGGGIFRLTDINSVVTVPLALDIDAGGTIDFPVAGIVYNRSVLVARSIVTNGVSLPPGRYTKSSGFITGCGTSTAPTVVIPIVWTGAGDGVSWSDAANWEGGVVPNATTAVADLSNARQAVRLDSAVTLTCLVYNPQGPGRSLTLTGNGSLSLYLAISYSAGLFVGPGRTLTLEVPLLRQGGLFTIIGGGAVVVRKEFPSVGALSSPAFALYGELIFAGQTAVADTLNLWRHEMNSVGSVVFTNGCHLSCNRIFNGSTGFFAVRQILHDGGEVTCGDVFFTRHNGNEATPYTYFMRSGTLTTTGANGVCLGVFYAPQSGSTWTRYSGGSFVMSGGTVSAARFAMGFSDNVLDLNGGEVNLGSGGIISTTNNVQGTVKLGNVALRAAANWSSALNMTLTGAGGSTLLDTAARTVTLSGALSGAGGLVKTGAGTLNLNGATNTFSGPLVVAGGTLACGAASVFSGVSELVVTNGTLALNGVVLSPDLTVRVSGTGTLTLPAGAALEVGRLYLNGSLRPAGAYTFGEGTVTVLPTAKIVWTGAAADGALWSNINNWTNTLSVPDGAGAALDFGYSQLAADDRVVLDVAPGVTLTNLTYGHGVPGSVLTLTCPEAVTNVLAFVSNGVIRVEEGQTLVLDTEVFQNGPLHKTGTGTLVLNRRTYSGDATGALSLYIMEGTVIGRGEFNRLRVQPASGSLLAPPPEFILEGVGAAIRDTVMTLPGYWNSGNEQGVFTQKGGTVDLSDLPVAFTNAGIGFIIAGGSGTKGVYNLMGGTLVSCSNQPAYLSGNSAHGTLNQSGGTSTFYRLNLTRPWPTTGGIGVLNLSGGTLRLAGTVEKGYSAGSLNFSGGRVLAVSNGVAFADDVPVTLATGASGDVAFAQAQAAHTITLPGTLSGNGGLVQEGPGTLALNGVNAFGGSVTVKGGTLLVSAPLQSVTDLYVDGGRLELLAAATCVTNLAVRAAAGSAMRIGGGATPFPDGLTLSLGQSLVTELDFDGIADVGRLVLGGQAKSPGLYGGVDSEAPAKPSSVYFTGTGTLRVLNGPAAQGTVLVIH
jgi:autotransporter-associated beta strand protein